MSNLIGLITLPCVLAAAPQYPFPQSVSYAFGTMPSSLDAATVQKAYDDFMERFYEESGDKARIKWDNAAQTVSEGIGYGMLITVYMDNAQNNTQAKFDKLWRYYNSFLNAQGLMNWKIDGFNGVAGQNAATDAEVDVAVALMEAYKQWGNEKYLNDAKDIIGKIAQFEVNENGYLKPGDSWDDKKNPSYFSTAALELFKKASTFDWSRVITNSYNLLKKSRNQSTGLVPDWCSEDGKALADYGYDAARAPWRIAWAYVWYGHNDAKDISSTIASWISSKTGNDGAKVVDGYGLDGSNKGASCNATFLGPLACAGMVDSKHQSWLDNSYQELSAMAATKDPYYSQSLKVITLLLLSGNMPDFWNMPIAENFTLAVKATPQNGGTIEVSPSGAEFLKGSTVMLKPIAANGFVFSGWSGDLSSTDTTASITMTKNTTITALFKPLSGTRPALANVTPARCMISFVTSTGRRETMAVSGLTLEKAFSASLYTPLGQLLAKQHVVSPQSKRNLAAIAFDNPLAAGVYVLRIHTQNTSFCRQIIID